MTVTTRFLAKCSVLEKRDDTWGKPLVSGLRPNLLMNGRFGICRITVLDECGEIAGGRTGVVRVVAEVAPQDRDDLKAGKEFELRAGPSTRWATCEIVEIEDVTEFEGEYRKQ